MSQNSAIINKSLKFSVRVVNLYKYLTTEKREHILSKQILRSATSIGANANEAVYAASRADFISKYQIALKEAAETEYWLKLLTLTEYISPKIGESLLNDCLELKKMLVATLNTSKAEN